MSLNQLPSSTQLLSLVFPVFLVKMSDSTVNLVSDSKNEISSTTGIGVSLDSHILLLGHVCMSPEVISLSDDPDSKKVFGDSLEE